MIYEHAKFVKHPKARYVDQAKITYTELTGQPSA
jgi:hypothetical protein